MKTFFLALTSIFLLADQALGCSEAGPREFEISAKMQSRCSKIALKYASDFANSMVKIEEKEKGYRGPKGGFKSAKSEPVLYTTQNRAGNSKLIGFNVGLDAKNKQECNFCVDMTIDAEENCRIESVRRHMCAN